MIFTPSAMGNIAATLAITETGVKSPINIALEGTAGNPIPFVTSVSPPTIYVNSPTTTITIHGSGFLPSTQVSNEQTNTLLATTFVSASALRTQIPDTVLTNPGDVFLALVNPPPAGGGNSTTVQVILQEPSISSLTPASIVAGTASEPVIVDGQNFMSGAKIQWNGVTVPTEFLNSTELQIQPTSAQLATAHLIQLTVNNPSPGTISEPAVFNVTYPNTLKLLDLPANDLVYDPFAKHIYASLPSSFSAHGNSIAVIDPTTGAVTGYHFVGSEPDHLALDSTSNYLYVGLDGSSSILRVKLPSFTPDIQIDLGTTSGPNLAGALAVSPADAHTIAVALATSTCCGGNQLEFFTDSTELADSVTSEPVNQLAFASGTTLYSYDQGTLSQITVNSTGGTLGTVWTNLVTGGDFDYSGGLVFGSNGDEFNPATGLLLGTFDVNNNTCCFVTNELLPNSPINRAFALGFTPFFNSFGITSYNLREFTPLAVTSLEDLDLVSDGSSTTTRFLQTGPSGLAFIVTNGCCNIPPQVVLVHSPTLLLAQTATPSPVPAVKSVSPTALTHGSGNHIVKLIGSGFVPGSVVNWNGSPLSASYVSSSEMMLYVTGADIAAAGTEQLQVVNPTPGGGTSALLPFTIN
jgi:hypothetical protein